MDLGINNKVALVTAASQGLGKASAIELAKEGVKLAICSRDEEKIKKAANDIKELTNSEVYCIQADLSNKEDIDNLVSHVEKELGNIDILVNNTGGQGWLF